MSRKRFSIGQALGAGFGLGGQRPLTLFVWGLLTLLPSVGIVAWMGALALDAPFSTFAAESGDMTAELRRLSGQFNALSGLSNALQLVIWALVAAAAYRLVLEPASARRRPFALGLGMDEVRVGVAALAVLIAIYALVIVVVLLCFGVGFALWGVTPEAARPWLIALLPAFGLLIALIAYARLSLIGPASVASHDFAFAEGWTMAKGHVGRLILMSLAVWVTVMVVTLAAYAAIALIGWGVWMALGLNPDWPRNPETLRELIPADRRFWIVPAVVLIPLTWLYGWMTAMTMAPYASVVAQLRPGQEPKVAPAGEDGLESN